MRNSQKTRFLSLLLVVTILTSIFATSAVFASTPYTFADPVIKQAALEDLIQNGFLAAGTTDVPVDKMSFVISPVISDNVTTWADLANMSQLQTLTFLNAQQSALSVPDESGLTVAKRLHTVMAEGAWNFDASDFASIPTLETLGLWGVTNSAPAEAVRIESKMDSIIANITHDGMTSFDKILAVHDWAVRTLSYSENNPGDVYDSRGAFDYNSGLCGTYTYAAVALLNRMGIQARYLQGRTGGGSHAWVGVNIDGSWVNMDLLWDDNQTNDTAIKYDFFLTSDAELLVHDATRTWKDNTNPVNTLDATTPFADISTTLNGFASFAQVDNRTSTMGQMFFANPSDGNKLYTQAYNDNAKTLLVDAPVTKIRATGTKVYFTNTYDHLVYSANFDGSDIVESAYPGETAGVGDEITFADPLVEAAVRAKAGIYGRPLTETDVSGIQTLVANGANSLSGFESLTALREFVAQNGTYTDVSPLQNLTNLNKVILSYSNSVTTIAPLKSLNLTVFSPWYGLYKSTPDGVAKIFAAEEAVILAETTRTQANIDAARTAVTLVTANPNALKARVDAIQAITALETATNAVVLAETTLALADYDAAVSLVTALPESANKTSLLGRLEAIVDQIELADATAKVVIAESAKTQDAVDAAKILIDALTNSASKTALLDRLATVQNYIDTEAAYAADLAVAVAAVQTAVASESQADVDAARILVNALREADKAAQTAVLDAVQASIDANAAIEAAYLIQKAEAEAAVANAESSKTIATVETAEALVSALRNADKPALVTRLDAVRDYIAAEEAYAEDLATATTAVQTAVDSATREDLNTARNLVATLRADDKVALTATLDAVEAVIEARETEEAAYLIQKAEAEAAVANAESSKTIATVETAEALVSALRNADKPALVARLDAVRDYIAAEEAYAEDLATATTAVQTAVDSETQNDVDAARILVNALRTNDKTTLGATLDAVQTVIDTREAAIAYANLMAQTEIAVANAEANNTPEILATADALVAQLHEADRATFEARLAPVRTIVENAIALANATTAVETAETTLVQNDIDYANTLVNALTDSPEKDALIARLATVQTLADEAAYAAKLSTATTAVTAAEAAKTQLSVDTARALVNQLHDEDKAPLLDRLTAIVVVTPPVVVGPTEPSVPTGPVGPGPVAPPAPIAVVAPIAPSASAQVGATQETVSQNGVETVVTTVGAEFFSANAPTVNPTNGNPVLSVNIDRNTTEQASVLFNASDLGTLSGNTDITINYGGIGYALPVAELNVAALQSRLGLASDVAPTIEFVIRQTSASEAVTLLRNANSPTYSILVEPTIFEVVAKAGDKTVNLDTFNTYVSRVIALPQGISEADVSTGVVINPDGTLSPVPTEFYTEGGTTYARIKSMTNSAYTVVNKKVTVASVMNHWARLAVNALASRLIIADPNAFVPGKEITRGEYLTYLLKGLGLYRSGITNLVAISDKGSLPYRDALTIAVQRGIITGYGNNTYKADATITRQEAMVIAARAMKVVGMKASDRTRATKFADYSKVQAWATEGVKDAVGMGLVNGSNGFINPNGTITFAESAQIVKNFMVKGGLMQE